MQQWEQKLIDTTGGNRVALGEALTRNGAEGWQVVAMEGGVTGLHTLLVVVKREIVPPEPPDGGEGWYPDPCGRWEIRHWTGDFWSAHVADSKTKARGIDPPQMLPPSDWPT